MVIDQLDHRTGRVFGYARVSCRDQRLRAQRNALSAVPVDRIYEDKASGAKARRKGLDAMLAALSAGDTVVVYRLDRLGRSVLHLAELLERFEADGIGFVSLAEGINTNTAGGRLVFHIFSAVADFQRQIIVENTRHGLDAARKSGKRLGRPRALNERQIREARQMMRDRRYSKTQIASRLGVSRMTLYRAVG